MKITLGTFIESNGDGSCSVTFVKDHKLADDIEEYLMENRTSYEAICEPGSEVTIEIDEETGAIKINGEALIDSIGAYWKRYYDYQDELPSDLL